MPNKTIYVRESDMELWEEAEKLSGGSVSGLIADALRRYVEEEKRKEEGMKTIEVLTGPDSHTRQKVRFEGRWLVYPRPDNPRSRSVESGQDANVFYGVALTKRGNVAVYVSSMKPSHDDTLNSYCSFEEAEQAGVPSDVLAWAAEAADPESYVQELDI